MKSVSKLKEEMLREELSNYEYYKQKYEALINSAKGNDERRYVRKSVYENKGLTLQEKNEMWKWLTRNI